MADFTLRPITSADWQWGGEVFRAAEQPGFLAEQDGGLAGLVIYHCEEDGCEVIRIDGLVRGQGNGIPLRDELELKLLLE